MTDPVENDPDVQAARARAEQAKARFTTTLHQLQHQIAPKTLAQNAWDGAKTKGADLAEDAVDVVKRRPVAAGGVVAALALFLAREPLLGLAGRLMGSKQEDEEFDDDDEDLSEIEVIMETTK